MKADGLCVEFDFEQFVCGFVVALVWVGVFSAWLLPVAVLMIVDFRFKGWPYLNVGYDNERGFYCDKGRYA